MTVTSQASKLKLYGHFVSQPARSVVWLLRAQDYTDLEFIKKEPLNGGRCRCMCVRVIFVCLDVYTSLFICKCLFLILSCLSNNFKSPINGSRRGCVCVRMCVFVCVSIS